MNNYINNLATEIMDSAHPAVVHHHWQAWEFTQRPTSGCFAGRTYRSGEEARNGLAAVLCYAAVTDQVFPPAVALKVAARIAERTASVMALGEAA